MPAPSRSLWDTLYLVGGNLGIGTFAPRDNLHVHGPGLFLEAPPTGSDDAHVYVRMQERGALDTFAIGCDFRGSGADNRLMITASELGERPTLSNAKVVVDVGGNVGVGSTTPTRLLEVAGDGTRDLLHVQGQAGAVTVTSAGRLGVGTDAPTRDLHVAGDTYVQGNLVVTGGINVDGQTVGCNLSTVAPFAASNGARVIAAADPAASNRVLYSLTLYSGLYLLQGNVPATDLSEFGSVIDNQQWATLGVWPGAPDTFDPNAPPTSLVSVPRLAASSNESVPVSFQFLVDVTEPGEHVVALAGDPNIVLSFAGDMNVLPIRNLGVDDRATVHTVLAEMSTPLVGTASSVAPFGADGAGVRTIATNDSVGSNLVLFSFTLSAGRYLLVGNVPFSVLDTMQFATVGLYAGTPATHSPSDAPLSFAALPAAAGPSNVQLPASFQFLVDVAAPADYVVALSGAGSTLAFHGDMSVVPIRGLGVDDSVAVRQALAIAPVRAVFTPQTPTSKFSLAMPGLFAAEASNVDLYRNGSKVAPTGNFDVAHSYDSNASNTTFVVTLASPAQLGTTVDISVQPSPPSAGMSYFRSGYLYQDVFVNSAVGTDSLLDGAVTAPKIADNSVTLAKVAPGAIALDVPGCAAQTLVSADFAPAYTYVYPGTASGYAAGAAAFVASLTPASSNDVGSNDFYYEVQAVDATNSVVLGSNAYSNATPAIAQLPLSNLPAGPAILQLEVRKGPLGSGVVMSCMQWRLSNA